MKHTKKNHCIKNLNLWINYFAPLMSIFYTRKSKKKSFIETYTLNDFVFDPQFMASDAARAIVNVSL